MATEIIVAIVSLIGTCAGTFGGIIVSNKLTNYRLEQLEKKVDKHNNLIERMALAERDICNIQCDVKEIKTHMFKEGE